MAQDTGRQTADDSVLHMPRARTHPEMGKVLVRRRGAETEVQFTLLMEPDGELAEGWRTAVALDASASMRTWFGRTLTLAGPLPPEMAAQRAAQSKRVVDRI